MTFKIVKETKAFINQCEIPEHFYNSAKGTTYTNSVLNTPPYMTGVANGVIDEVKSIPEIVIMATDLALDKKARDDMLQAFSKLTWAKVGTGIVNMGKEALTNFTNPTDKTYHTAGTVTTAVAMAVFFPEGIFKKGDELIKDGAKLGEDALEDMSHVVDKLDEAAEAAGNKVDDVVNGAGNWATVIGKNIDDLVEAPLGYQFYKRKEQKFIRRLSVSDPSTPQLTVKQGKIVQATGKVLTNADEIKLLLKTDANKSFFWSGRTSNGVGVMDLASDLAQAKGGTTLEGLLEKYKILMPEFNDKIPSIVKLWEDVSALYANQVVGEVRAVLGKNLRSGNIWETVELTRLKQNSNVSKIYTIDPETKIEILLWTR